MNFLGKLNRCAFTLAELMAVVIIVAIIAGIGFGSYRKAVERAIFNEGLAGAHTLAAAYDTYYYDHNYTHPTSVNSLDVSLTGTVHSAALGVTTKNFFYKLGEQGVVVANRVNGNYQIVVVLETSGQRINDRCVGGDASGIEFCESMGYSCGSGNEKC